MRLCIFAAFAMALAACQTRAGFDERLSTWKGRPIVDYVAEWGGPNWINESPTGEKLYTWQFGESRKMHIDSFGRSGAGLAPLSSDRVSSVCTVTLTVVDGIIKNARGKGDACLDSAP